MSDCVEFNTMNQLQKKRECWFLYILKCSDSTLYTGITCDISRRLKQHNNGRASLYTRSRLPVELFFLEMCSNKSDALKKEFAIKSKTRKQKMEYISLNCGSACYIRKTKLFLSSSILCAMLGLWFTLSDFSSSSICNLMHS